MQQVEKQIQKFVRQVAIGSTILLIYTIAITIWSTCNGCMNIETSQFAILIFGIATGKLYVLTATAVTTIVMSMVFIIQNAWDRLGTWQPELIV